MTGTPLVSVCMVTYNHEKYVGAAIQSVLDQSCSDWELIVVNDGSTDTTAARIVKFRDPRIVAIHQENQGPGAATNRGIAAARGKYIALFSGDDLCHPNRLQVQLDEYAKGGRRILFSDCDFVDESGRPIAAEHFAAESFAGAGYTRAQMLARLFHRGNFLNGVTVFTEREVLAEAPYDPTLLQLQDFELWVRLVAKYELCIQPKRLISYRIRGNEANLSSPSTDAVIRSANEHYLILRQFFDGVSLDLF